LTITGGRKIQIFFSWDTTGSMYPCLIQVERRLEEGLTTLFRELPNLEVAAGANGDYCDRHSSYVTRHTQLGSSLHDLCNFVRTVGRTGGGDAPECYEQVLRNAQSLDWEVNASKIVVLIADDVPHEPDYPGNTLRLDWRVEARYLRTMGVKVYTVQCLSRRHATSFYRELAEITGGIHFTLDQFSEMMDLLLAICYQQAGLERLEAFEQEVVAGRRMSRTLDASFGLLTNRTTLRYEKVADGLIPVPPGRFQIFEVEQVDPHAKPGDKVPIRDFVEAKGIPFKAGRGFYEHSRTELVQEEKEVVLRDRVTGDMFTGDMAREMIHLPMGERGKVPPVYLEKYRVFIQSTSHNRRLVPGTGFLYEVDLDR
jgi:hypothetical protein